MGEVGCCDAWMAEWTDAPWCTETWLRIWVSQPASLSLSVSLCLSLSLSVSLSLSLSVCLSLSLSLSVSFSLCVSHCLIYLSVCLSVCLSICLSAYLPSCLSVDLCVCLFVYLSVSIYLSIFLSICIFLLSIYVSICLSVCPSIYLTIGLSDYLIYLSVCRSVCLSVRPSVRLPSVFLKEGILPDFLEKWQVTDPVRNPPISELADVKKKQFCEISSILIVNVKNDCMESCVQSEWPRTNGFAIFHPISLRLPRQREARSYEVLHRSCKATSANLKIRCSKLQPSLRKSLAWPPNISDKNVSSTARATRNAALQVIEKLFTVHEMDWNRHLIRLTLCPRAERI